MTRPAPVIAPQLPDQPAASTCQPLTTLEYAAIAALLDSDLVAAGWLDSAAKYPHPKGPQYLLYRRGADRAMLAGNIARRDPPPGGAAPQPECWRVQCYSQHPAHVGLCRISGMATEHPDGASALATLIRHAAEFGDPPTRLTFRPPPPARPINR